MNKKAGFTDIFLFLIFTIIVVFICGMFIYLGIKAQTEITTNLPETIYTLKNGTVIGNSTEMIENSMGSVNRSYQSLTWISALLIIGMAISIFIGSYMVTTRPVFFIPYLIITIIAIISSVPISNIYGDLLLDPTIGPTFQGFSSSNFILEFLPLWTTVIGIGGAIIMFARMGSKEQVYYGGAY